MLILAVLPGIVLFVMVWKKDKIEKEPASLLLKLFILGALTTVSAMIIGMFGTAVLGSVFDSNSLAYLILDNFIVTALVEEGGKYFVMKKATWKHPAFNFTFDAIVYAVTASLGFAVIENILYVFENDVSTAIMRAIFSVPGHVFDAIFMGYYYGIAKVASAAGDTRAMRSNLKKALWVPVLLHGFYDFCLGLENEVFTLVFLAFDVVLTVVAIKRLRTSARADSAIYPEDEGGQPPINL